MAQSKSITINYQNQNNATSPVAVSFASEPIVQDGYLVASIQNSNPGIFTQGTRAEGTSANPTNDSNP